MWASLFTQAIKSATATRLLDGTAYANAHDSFLLEPAKRKFPRKCVLNSVAIGAQSPA